MAGWHHRLNGHESEQTPGISEGQGSQHAVDHGVAKSQTQLSNWTATTNAVSQYTGTSSRTNEK